LSAFSGKLFGGRSSQSSAQGSGHADGGGRAPTVGGAVASDGGGVAPTVAATVNALPPAAGPWVVDGRGCLPAVDAYVPPAAPHVVQGVPMVHPDMSAQPFAQPQYMMGSDGVCYVCSGGFVPIAQIQTQGQNPPPPPPPAAGGGGPARTSQSGAGSGNPPAAGDGHDEEESPPPGPPSPHDHSPPGGGHDEGVRGHPSYTTHTYSLKQGPMMMGVDGEGEGGPSIKTVCMPRRVGHQSPRLSAN